MTIDSSHKPSTGASAMSSKSKKENVGSVDRKSAKSRTSIPPFTKVCPILFIAMHSVMLSVQTRGWPVGRVSSICVCLSVRAVSSLPWHDVFYKLLQCMSDANSFPTGARASAASGGSAQKDGSSANGAATHHDPCDLLAKLYELNVLELSQVVGQEIEAAVGATLVRLFLRILPLLFLSLSQLHLPFSV